MRQIVGIDRKIKRAWLDAVLDRLVQTTDEADLRPFLDNLLQDELPGNASRANTTGILLRIWCSIPQERIPLRDRALALLPLIPGQERIWLHWGMAARAYPFFRDAAEIVGRLLALQDDFTSAQVQARMLTAWGDRATSKEAAQKLTSTLVDWEVLCSTKMRGHFLLARKFTASIPDLQLWLLEALLGAGAADEVEAQQLLRLPETFPFTISVGVGDLRRHEGFDIHRQGLDMDMVALHKVKLGPPPKRSKKPNRGMPAQVVQPGLFEDGADGFPTNSGRPSVVNANEVNCPFAAALMECSETFRSGQYFCCTALSLAVLEAMIWHVWQVKLKKRPNQHGSFDKNLDALFEKGFINYEWQARLKVVWADRLSSQYLRDSVDGNQPGLRERAHKTLALVNDLAQEFFGFSVQDGRVVPEHY